VLRDLFQSVFQTELSPRQNCKFIVSMRALHHSSPEPLAGSRCFTCDLWGTFRPKRLQYDDVGTIHVLPTFEPEVRLLELYRELVRKLVFGLRNFSTKAPQIVSLTMRLVSRKALPK